MAILHATGRSHITSSLVCCLVTTLGKLFMCTNYAFVNKQHNFVPAEK